MNEYGAFYIAKTKFVLAITKEDEKTKRLIENLRKVVPSAVIEVKPVDKTANELKKIQGQITERLKQEGYDNFGTSDNVMEMKVVIYIDKYKRRCKK